MSAIPAQRGAWKLREYRADANVSAWDGELDPAVSRILVRRYGYSLARCTSWRMLSPPQRERHLTALERDLSKHAPNGET